MLGPKLLLHRKSTIFSQICMQSFRLHGNILPDSRTLRRCEPPYNNFVIPRKKNLWESCHFFTFPKHRNEENKFGQNWSNVEVRQAAKNEVVTVRRQKLEWPAIVTERDGQNLTVQLLNNDRTVKVQEFQP